MLDAAERVVRIAGVGGLLTAWAAAGWAVTRSRQRATGAGLGLAPKLGAPAAYALAAIPYFGLWVLLWRPLPGSPPEWGRLLALAVGAVLGAAGLGLYLWGRFTLGSMYNVSSALGTELYADQRLVISGPFRYVRHPMYVGICGAALGGLAVYRTWAMVFAVAALPAFAVKARHEERLLAAAFGTAWEEYTQRVPAWWPRPESGLHRHAIRPMRRPS
jgi:protein-S-isoprenylcysteine O-methyltransferase Ste14